MNLRTTDLSSPAPVSITPEPVAPAPGAASDPTVVAPVFSVWRSLKLGTFHIGSSLTDLLTSAVWNRILIVDLGVAAWPVALLTALRYLLAPLTLWAGHQSDSRPLFGSRRVAYIWPAACSCCCRCRCCRCPWPPSASMFVRPQAGSWA